MRVTVRYPLDGGELKLRTDADWDRNVEPLRADQHQFEFEVAASRPFVYFKPVVRDGDTVSWSQGDNYLAIATDDTSKEIYPHFDVEPHCNACELTELAGHRFRVFHPPGYDENTLKRYPVLYMHDGQNLFFADEAFGGNEWKVDETMNTLDAMNIIDKVIVVGIYSRDRMREN